MGDGDEAMAGDAFRVSVQYGFSANYDDPIIIKVAPMLQIQHAEADAAVEGEDPQDAVRPPMCNDDDAKDCTLGFGQAGVSIFNYRSVALANRAHVP